MKHFHSRIAFVVLCLSVGLMTLSGSFPLLSQGPGEGEETPPPNTGEPTPEDPPGGPGDLIPGDETPGPVGQVDELTAALVANSVDSLTALLNSGTDPNQQIRLSNEIQVPVVTSAVMSSKVMPLPDKKIKILLDAGANPNVADQKRGYTALHWAAIDSHRSVVKLLLDYGADRQIRTLKGNTPYELALKIGNMSAVFAFEEHSTFRHPRRDEWLTRAAEAKFGPKERSRKGGHQ